MLLTSSIYTEANFKQPRHTASLNQTFHYEICLVYNLANVGVGVGNDPLQF